MPKIYEYFGFVFFLNSNDHKPLHFHVRYGEYESAVEPIISEGKLVEVKFMKIKGKPPIQDSDRKAVEKFISIYYLKIVQKWTQFYLLNLEPKNEKITKKLK